MAPCVCCRDPTTCPKNRIEYIQDRKGCHAELVLVHFKNDTLKGEQHLPLSPKLRELIALVEQGRAATGGDTLFCSMSGAPYKLDYFSTVVGNLLVFDGKRLTPTDFRHLFSTAWRDFINSPNTWVVDQAVQQLEGAAAGLMLNSSAAWDATYDDSSINRSIHRVMAMWPKFVEFVKEQHLDQQSRTPYSPLTVDMALLK